jgi:hypothetical protein
MEAKMSKAEDILLMREIKTLADEIEKNQTMFADDKAVVIFLAGRFNHRPVEEIEEKAKEVWNSRSLHWRE